jgi:hypothetical protein
MRALALRVRTNKRGECIDREPSDYTGELTESIGTPPQNLYIGVE